jgi:hypothetical protein
MDSATFVIIHPRSPDESSLPQRFPKVLALGERHGLYRLPHPEIPAHPMGSSAPVVTYALGHGGKPLAPLTHLTPEALRHLRSLTHKQRLNGGTFHIFGLLDNDSPYGSRRLLEEMLRFLHSVEIKTAVHVGVWHPTPHEFRYGLKEIGTLCQDSITLASLFPVSLELEDKSAERYVDGILHPVNSTPQAIVYPLKTPIYLSQDSASADDVFVIINHSLHGLDSLAHALQDLTGELPDSLTSEHVTDPTILRSLNKNRHLLSLSTNPSYQEAYFGSHLEHPYFETISHNNSEELLEMLLSPHFGYTQQPYRTVVITHEPSSSNFDWLVSSYLKKNHDRPYYCCLISPLSIEGTLVVTNMSFPTPTVTYQQLQAYD